MVTRRSLLNLLHNQHVFGQSLHRLDEVILQRQQLVIGIEPRLIDKVLKIFVLHQLVDQERADGVIVEILEVELEEVYLFFYFVEDDLKVPVLAGCLEDGGKEEFIQLSDLIDIHEDGVGLLPANDLLIDQWRLEIRDDDAQISDIVFLGIKKFLYDHFPTVKVLCHPLDPLAGEHALYQSLDFDCGFSMFRIIGLHAQLLSS